MPRIGVVIPVYKAEACLEELYRRLKAALETITDDFEILLIEDCGGDRSWPMIVDLALLWHIFGGRMISGFPREGLRDL